MAEKRSKAQIAAERRLQHKKKQKRLLITAFTMIALILLGWGGYSYFAGAEGRSVVSLDEGRALMHPGAWAEAIPYFDAAIADDPNNAPAYYERARAYHEMGDDTQALADFERVRTLNPEDVEAYNAIANIYLEQGDPEKALESLSTSLRLAPSADGYNQRGQAYAALNRHQEAIEDFTESLELRRDSPYVYLARANSLKALGDIEAARADEAKAESFVRTITKAPKAKGDSSKSPGGNDMAPGKLEDLTQ